jgi:hypothetical protein
LAWLVPLVLTGFPDVVGVAIGVLILSGALGAFFLSLRRLHGQVVEVKTSELAIARELYAQAYEPVRTTRARWRRSNGSTFFLAPPAHLKSGQTQSTSGHCPRALWLAW